MTSFAWGADAPMFDERELRRLGRQLRVALASFLEQQPTPPHAPAGGTDQDDASTGERQPDPAQTQRSERPDWSDLRRAHREHCGPGWHGHGFRGEFPDEQTREAWREQRRAAWRAMMTGEDAPDRERRARSEESRGKGPKGERAGKGKHKHRGEDDSMGHPEHGEREERGPRGPWGGPRWGGSGWGGPGGPFQPFGPFGGFGPGPGGPGRGPRGRGPGWRFEGGRGRAGRGDVRLAILALLSEGPRHGYQLIQDITERSEGAWAPSPGSIYPALSALQDEGLIDDQKLEGRRVFSLTPAGEAYVAARDEQIKAVFEQNAPTSEHEALAEVGKLMWGVGEAALTVLGTGTEAQRAEARDLLARTRRDLFRILAEDSWTTEPAAEQPRAGEPEESTGPASEESSAGSGEPSTGAADAEAVGPTDSVSPPSGDESAESTDDSGDAGRES